MREQDGDLATGVTLRVLTRADGTEDHAFTGPEQRDTPESGVPPVSEGSDDPQLPGAERQYL